MHQLLKTPSKPFEPPTAQSKTDYGTKTAAINVVPDKNDPYDINQIKDDALWLSGSLQVNEVAALRIAVVEYHSRAQSHLTGPLSTQDIASIQEAAGVSDAQASSILALLNVSAVVDAETTWAGFETEANRRQRLLATYLSERRSFMSVVDALLTFLLHSRATAMGPEVDALRRAVVKEAFGFDELADMNISAFEELALKYLGLLDDCIGRSQSGPNMTDRQIFTEQLEVDWIRTALTEAIHAMSIAFQVLDLGGQIFAPQDVVAQWFRFVETFQFLEPLGGVSIPFYPSCSGRR